MASLATVYNRILGPKAVSVGVRNLAASADDEFVLRTIPNEEIYFFVKEIDNGRVVRAGRSEGAFDRLEAYPMRRLGCVQGGIGRRPAALRAGRCPVELVGVVARLDQGSCHADLGSAETGSPSQHPGRRHAVGKIEAAGAVVDARRSPSS